MISSSTDQAYSDPILDYAFEHEASDEQKEAPLQQTAKQRRQEKNRLSAARSRARKAAKLERLEKIEDSISSLKDNLVSKLGGIKEFSQDLKELQSLEESGPQLEKIGAIFDHLIKRQKVPIIRIQIPSKTNTSMN